MESTMGENAQTEIILYGTTWCGDTTQSRRLLDRNGIKYKWVDIDQDPEGEKFVKNANRGNRSVPTILFPDGSILVEPSDSALMKKLGK
jgi:mycoredoxin